MQLRNKANPVDLEFPEQREEADNGARQANVDLVAAAIESMIRVEDCAASVAAQQDEEDDA